MEIAVIGGSGFLGSHLIEELSGRDCSIRILTSRSPGAEERSNPDKVTRAKISFDDENDLLQALSGCDAVVYLSGINREKHPGDFQKVHVENLAKVIAVAGKLSIKKLVYASFLKARPGTVSKYLQSKWDGEVLLRNSTLDYTILKPGICFGSGDQMISSIVRGLRMTPYVGIFGAVGLHEPLMSPLHAQDMAVIMASALLDGKLSRQTNLVLGPEALPLSEAVKRVAKVMKKKVLIINVPVPVMFAFAWILEHVMVNSLVTVSQIRMLADGLSHSQNKPDKLSELSEEISTTENALPLPNELKPKTYFTEQQIRVAIGQIS